MGMALKIDRVSNRLSKWADLETESRERILFGAVKQNELKQGSMARLVGSEKIDLIGGEGSSRKEVLF